GGGLVALGLQSSLVLRRNGGGDGQPQAEAGLLSPGGVRPVESLEQAAQLVRWDGIAGVGYQQTGLPVCAPQGQADGTPRLPILDGVVQQDADQLAQFVGVAGDGHVGGDVALQGLSRLKGHRLKGQYAVRGQVGERDLPHHRRGNRIVRPGQGQHLLHQGLHLSGLGADVVRPPGRAVLQRRRLQQFRIGEDHGQRRLQLVRGVGKELPLLLPGLCHRAGGPPGQQDGDAQKQQQR
ncbi:Stage 0 sporulation A-like protein, partial [Dysosmobacter welbionis]